MFGRRPILLGGLLFFAVGSAMCGAAVNMKYVIMLSVVTLGSHNLNVIAALCSQVVPFKASGRVLF